MSSGLFYWNSLDKSISNRRGVWLVFIIDLPYFITIPVFNANSVDPNQMLRSAASDPDLQFTNVHSMRS